MDKDNAWCKKAVIAIAAVFVIGLIARIVWMFMGCSPKNNVEYFKNLNSPGPFPLVFELYKVGWCKHCKGMNPEWEKLAKKYEKDPSIQIKTIDVDEFPEAAQAENITGLPTMILKDGAGAKIVYEGERTSAIMGEFVESAKAVGVPAVMESTMASTPALLPVPVPAPAPTSSASASSPPDLPIEENLPTNLPSVPVPVPILKKKPPMADAPMMIIEPDGDDSDAGVGMGSKAQVTGEILAAPV